jgi:hypothetical protein
MAYNLLRMLLRVKCLGINNVTDVTDVSHLCHLLSLQNQTAVTHVYAGNNFENDDEDEHEEDSPGPFAICKAGQIQR